MTNRNLAALVLFAAGLTLGMASKAEAPSQIKELAGLILLDATVETTGVQKVGKWVDLIEVSTPSTPSSNHAAVWLNAQGLTKQGLKVIFDDGTIVSIAAN